MKKINVNKLGVSAMFMAIGLVLPFFTGQIQNIGNMLLPMHIPVFLCGLICGWKYGAVVGFILPLMRSALFGMPVMFPNAVAMSFELMTYGLVVGLIYLSFKKKNIIKTYISLIIAMIAGRLVWAVAQIIILGMLGNAFTAKMFIAGAFLNAIPGIIVQLILIPMIMARVKVE